MNIRRLLVMFAVAMIFLVVNGYLLLVQKHQTHLLVDQVTDSKSLGYSGQRKIGSDRKGNWYIAYRKDVDSYSEIFVAQVAYKQNTWHVAHTERPIARVDRNTEQRVPSIAIDRADSLHAVWYGSDTEGVNDDRQIKYTRSDTQGMQWLPWRNISYVSGHRPDQTQWQEHPMVLAGNHNDLYVVWEGKDDQHNQPQIKFSQSSNNGNSWSGWKNIQATDSTAQSRPTLVQDQQGTLYVFMYGPTKQNKNVVSVQYAVSLDQGASWSQWNTLSDPRYDARHISSVVDRKNQVHVVWRQQGQGSTPSRIIYQNMSQGKWSDQQQLNESQAYQLFPSIGVLDNDDMSVVVTWMETADASGFPQEQPVSGQAFIARYNEQKDKFNPPQPLVEGSMQSYPHLPATIPSQRMIPVVSLWPRGDRKHDLAVDLIDLNRL